jgi:hypothetical protein
MFVTAPITAHTTARPKIELEFKNPPMLILLL